MLENKDLKLRYIVVTVVLLVLIFYASDVLSSENHYSCQSCNIIYISVDPLSAEHMGVYGYERNTTPNIDRLANESYVFRKAFSQSSHTMPSLYSTFTSTYPVQHGVYPGSHTEEDNYTMLAELLKKEGYDTFSLNGGANIRGELGFELGFREYEDYIVNGTYMDKKERYSHIRRNIEKSDGKFFFFYQSFRTHDPYFISDNYTELFGPSLPDFRNESRRVWSEKNQEYNSSGDLYNAYRDYYFGKASDNDTVGRFIESQYDGTIRRSDAFIGGIIDVLKEKGEYENSIIIVNSQHGEQFGEHGKWRHDTSLYNEIINVPLIVHFPGQENRKTVDKYVENVDLAPTLIDIVRENNTVPRSVRDQWKGTSLKPIFKGKDIEKKFVLAERPSEKAFIEVEKGIKYYDYDSGEEFYNLENDFREQTPLNKSEEISGVKKAFERVYTSLNSKDISIGKSWPYFG